MTSARSAVLRGARGAACALAWLSTIPASACAFDATLPDRTAADWVLDSDPLVLARPLADTPYRHLSIDKDLGTSDLDLDLAGPLASVTFRF